MQIRLRSLWLASAILTLSSGVAALHSQQTNIDRDLEEAKTLYREARFSDAIVKLQTSIDRLKLLENLRARAADLADAYLHLGLSYFALAELDAAKEQFKNVLRIDPTKYLDPQVFAPQVIALLEEARAELGNAPAVSVGHGIPGPSPSGSPSPQAKKGGLKALPILLGLGAAGGIGAAVAGRARSTDSNAAPNANLSGSPDLDFLGSDPAPGSTISLGFGGTVLRVQVSAVFNRNETLQVWAEDRHDGSTRRQCICGPSTPIQFAAGQPVSVTVNLSYPCTGSFVSCPPLPYTSTGLQVTLFPAGSTAIYFENFTPTYTFTK